MYFNDHTLISPHTFTFDITQNLESHYPECCDHFSIGHNYSNYSMRPLKVIINKLDWEIAGISLGTT